jgi:type IV secretion system protein TrbC
MIVIIGIVITGGMLMFGNDLSGFGRRVMLLVLGGGLVLGATQVIGLLFSADTSGASYSLEEPLYRNVPASQHTTATNPE